MNTRGVICLVCGEVADDVAVQEYIGAPAFDGVESPRVLWKHSRGVLCVIVGPGTVVPVSTADLHVMPLAVWVTRCRAWPRLRP